MRLLWRWDTDWFWCSRAFGAQNRLVRALWPKRWLRSDVYAKLVRWESRHQVVARLDHWRGKPRRERVVQDVEIPLGRTAEFLRWFLREVPITPVWLCPLRLRQAGATPVVPARGDGGPWPLYPLQPDQTYVNVGFWSTVPIAAGTKMGRSTGGSRGSSPSMQVASPCTPTPTTPPRSSGRLDARFNEG